MMTHSELIRSALSYISEELYDHAETIAEKAISLYPSSSEAYFTLSEVYWGKAQSGLEKAHYLDLCMRALDKAIEMDPAQEEPYCGKGHVYLAQKKYTEAVEAFTSAISINGNYRDARYSRALAYIELCDYTNALADLDELLRINPNDAETLLQMGFVHYEMKDFETAEADLTAAIEINPREAAYYYERAYILAKPALSSGDVYAIKKALKDLNMALSLNAVFVDALLIRVECYNRIGERRLAEQDWIAARQLSPDIAEEAISYLSREAMNRCMN